MHRLQVPTAPASPFAFRAWIASALTAAMAGAQVTLSVDRLDAADPGGPAPANLVVVDVFADVATTDTWTAAGLRATAANGAVLRYGAGSALINPGLADRFVTSLSRPLARNADGRFNNALAATAGRYDPTGPTPTATAAEVNAAWFSSPPATSTSPSVDGYIARVAIDITAATTIDPATIVVAPGLPPPGTVALLVSQPAAGSAATAGTVAATFDIPSVTGTNWCVYASPGPACANYAGSTDPSAGVCNAVPFGASPPTSLTTMFAQNNRGAVGGAVYFDVNVTAGLWVDGLSLNTVAAAGTPMTVRVHRTAAGGTRVGNETNPAAWIPETMGFGTAAGVDAPSSIELNRPFHLAPGTYGIAVVAFGFAHAYTNGANAFGDANLTIQTGSAGNTPFVSTPLTPRTANLALRYHAEAGQFANQRYQTILRRSQLAAGRITGLAFAACASGRHWNESLRIRMSHVPAGTALSTTFASNLPAPVTVLDARDHVWHLTGNAWNEIGLQRAFDYDGTSDLVVEITARGNFHTQAAAFRRGDPLPRVAAFGWAGTPPATATGSNSVADNSGVMLRVQRSCADASEYGWSCGGLTAGHSGVPVPGRTFAFTFRGAPVGQLVFLNLGFDNAPPTYPFSLAPFGLATCELFHDIVATVSTVADGAGGGSQSYTLTPSPSWRGVRFYGQWLTIDPRAPGGFAVANYVRMLGGD